MMRDDVTPSSLSSATKEKLLAAGIKSAVQLKGLKVTDLAKRLRIQNEDAIAMKRDADAAFGWAISKSSIDTGPGTGANAAGGIWRGQTALEILEKERGSTVRGIPTFCKELDEMLGGGVQLGSVTEFCGAPGIGKTQLCMQLALDAQIPTELGGAGGGAVYIDTEGSMVPARLEQMAQHLSRHLSGLVRKRNAPSLLAAVEGRCTPGALMAGVHVYRCKTLGEQLALVNAPLCTFLDAHRDVRLVALDSVAFHFRYGGLDGDGFADTRGGGGDPAARSRMLQQLGASLHRVAAHYNVAVVLVNQMTTRIDSTVNSGSSSADSMSSGTLVPALGETWAHVPNHRLILQWDAVGMTPVRTASLVKSNCRPPATCRYQVTEQGFRSYKVPSSGSAATTAPSAGGDGSSAGASSSASRKRQAEEPLEQHGGARPPQPAANSAGSGKDR